jgi:hypothetical protein
MWWSSHRGIAVEAAPPLTVNILSTTPVLIIFVRKITLAKVRAMAAEVFSFLGLGKLRFNDLFHEGISNQLRAACALACAAFPLITSTDRSNCHVLSPE